MGGILFVQTGGTIDKDYPRTTKGWAFEIGEEPAFVRTLAKLNPSFEYETVTAMRKDSLEITDQDREELLNCIISHEKYDKIIITHGTDTMAETARYLATSTRSKPELACKTMVLTGSMRPERFSNSDADVNLGMAISAVQILDPGSIVICMHGLVIPYDQVQRNVETGQFERRIDE